MGGSAGFIVLIQLLKRPHTLSWKLMAKCNIKPCARFGRIRVWPVEIVEDVRAAWDSVQERRDLGMAG